MTKLSLDYDVILGNDWVSEQALLACGIVVLQSYVTMLALNIPSQRFNLLNLKNLV